MEERTGDCRLLLGRREERLALWKASSALALPERLHLAVRFRSAPWERLLPALAASGELLDVGCGPGLLAHLLRRAGFSGTYLGIDPDPRKIARALRWLPDDGRFRFEATRLAEVPRRSFSQVAVVDVLYLVAPSERGAFVAGAASALRPGGTLVALTSGGGPPWKRRLDRLQERLAVTAGVTRGETVAPCDGAEIGELFRRAGLAGMSVADVGSGYSHGFELVTGRLPEAAG